jgi:hypothetical protein
MRGGVCFLLPFCVLVPGAQRYDGTKHPHSVKPCVDAESRSELGKIMLSIGQRAKTRTISQRNP